MRLLCVTATLCISTALVSFADPLAEKWKKRIDSAEATYFAAVIKADNARYFAVQKANTERIKVLKTAMGDALKVDDFDAASVLKDRVANAEKEVATKPKPNKVAKFGGHEYALIEDIVTWHVAKKRCEEMGGHLATIESEAENTWLLGMCKEAKAYAWIGATDELVEGDWRWVTGAIVEVDFRPDNSSDAQHYMLFWPPAGTWDDNGASRNSFVCEWEK